MLVAVATLVICTVPLSAIAQAAAASTGPPSITWLAAGDSYASGQGLAHPDGLCARGTGQGNTGTTWAIGAGEVLRSRGMSFAKGSPDLVACTGAISADLLADNSKKLGPKHVAQWKPSMGRYDLVTFSFGGDDVGFASIMKHCEEFGCPSDSDVRAKIRAMASTGVNDNGIKTQPYHSFLQSVANTVVVKGGNVVVMGYPELVEEVGLWNPGRTTCAGMSPGEVQRVRGWAGDLNATIGSAVDQVNALPAAQRNDVHLTFIDPVTGQSTNRIASDDANLFEPSSGARHELCSRGEAWINPEIKLDVSHSFHPTQAGETAMGHLAAHVISQLNWPWAPWEEANTKIVSTGGVIGTLQIGLSTEADIETAAGPPQSTSIGNMVTGNTGNQSVVPNYKALGYDCNQPSGDPIDSCQTIYFLDASTGLLQSFSTRSPLFRTTNGTAVGTSVSMAEQLEGQQFSSPGCEPASIYLGGTGTTAWVAIRSDGQTVTSIESENSGPADPSAPEPNGPYPGNSGIGLLFC